MFFGYVFSSPSIHLLCTARRARVNGKKGSCIDSSVVRLCLHPGAYDYDPPSSFQVLVALVRPRPIAVPVSTSAEAIALLERVPPLATVLSPVGGLLGVAIPRFEDLPRLDAPVQSVSPDRSHDAGWVHLGGAQSR